ncbi:MAG TPA: DNA-binding domain-containing protein [Anaeromyxobacteraceae bacterium]|nr:DNA-binding domain-containing protein [Anaeromyxobacteraceae bacterium]
MTLAETQALFAGLLTGDEPAAPGRIAACFAGTPALPAEARVGIYAGMYRWRHADALRATFPALARWLGEDRFLALATDYVRAHPSDHHDLGRLGRRLAAFLRDHPDRGRPDLADLAALEWARQEVFFAPPIAPAGADALVGLSPSAFARRRLALSPALRVLRLAHDAAALWRAIDAGHAPAPPAKGRFAVAVWRRGFDVFHGALALDEAAALRGAAAGDPLARVCAAFGDRAEPAAAAHAALSRWLEEGWILAAR